MPADTTASGPAGRYATALFELASQNHVLDQVEGDLAVLGRAIEESPDLARMIASPVVSRDGQANTMSALAAKMGLGQTVQNFLGVLAKQRRLGALAAIIADFRRQLAAHRGEETAQVISAVALDETQLAAVRDAVAGYAGRPVQLSAAVDPSLLGGLVVRIGSRMIDASLRTKLNNLELSMRGLR